MDVKDCILVVDDEESQRKTLSLFLKKKGYLVESAGTGKATLELARSRTFNLALLDINLPDTEGIELIVPLKQINPDMAIIMVTGFASVENTVYSMNAGASGYLMKPVNNDEMLAKIQDLLERQALIREKRLIEEALRQANRKLNLLSGITRHDIKNQLQGLLVYLDRSKESLGDPILMADFIAKEEAIAETIAHQISFTSDYEDMGVKAPAWQNVTSIIKKVITRLPMQNIHVDAGDPDLEMFADPLLEKVFHNLIDNALRYGGEQITTIRVTNREDNENMILVFEDDGKGVSSDDKKQLFTKGFGKHTGLGLYLSREILSITDITISEHGEPGKGARFEITVPRGKFRTNN